MSTTRFAGVTSSLMACVYAQSTYVVDIANGPGTHFTQIAAAVAAVPSGSVLSVRAGRYAPVVIDAKALVVLCDAQTTVGWSAHAPSLSVRNTSSTQRVVVRGLRTTSDGRIEVTSASGIVLLDGVGGSQCSLSVSGSAQVVVRNASFMGRIPSAKVAGTSRVVFESCALVGRHGGVSPNGSWSPPPTGSALDIGLDDTACNVHLVACTALGGAGGHYGSLWLLIPYPGSPAIRLGGGSSLRASGTTSHYISAGPSPLPVAAMTGAGSARIHPSVVVQPAPTSTATLTVTRPDLSNLTTTGGALGGTVTIERQGASGVAFAIALSLPGAPSPWLGEPDPLWLDPATTVVEAFGVATGSPFQLQRAVPAIASLLGVTVLWQGVDFAASGSLPLSNPSAVVLH